jgi:hypothetical protein|tara:strand:+ start:371 stop:556 length:186 start_codon:yes stop_codon:yes gene_type:complete
MKIGDLVVSKAYEKYANIVPAKLVMNVSNRAVSGPESPYIVLEDEPEDWKPAYNFFVVSRA